MTGINGKIARVNLTTGTIGIEEPDEVFYRRYFGGRNIILYYLLKELSADTDPLSPENKLIFATSILTGAAYPGLGRNSVGAKSPLTGLYGDSEAGGFFGPELRFAGFEALIIEGASTKPVYLWIKDGTIEIRDASRMWGMNIKETSEAIKKELEDKQVRLEMIGPAGENLVLYAGVSADINHFHGRSGLGAVMGSKKLKAVAVRGTEKLDFFDKEKIKALSKWYAENFKSNPESFNLYTNGSQGTYFHAYAAGTLPTRNFSFAKPEELGFTIDEMHTALKKGSDGCYACMVRCKPVMASEKPYEIDPVYGGPEYETLGGFGALLEVKDYNVICKAHELCNKYGLDTISTSVVIAFAMECYEEGLLAGFDLEGIEPLFGNGEAVLQLIEKIAHREGIGDFLALGVKRCAEKIGKGADKYAMHVKGQEFPLQEPRAKYGVALAFAVSPTGADHIQHIHDGAYDPANLGYTHKVAGTSAVLKESHFLGILEPVESLSLSPEKIRLFLYTHFYYNLINVLDICLYTFGPIRVGKLKHIVELAEACTGWNISFWELMKAGERASTMARCFNIVHGATKADDTLPDRLFETCKRGGFEGSRIKREDFFSALDLFYEMMGWDKNGVPMRGKLYELELGWMEEKIEPYRKRDGS
jgi:aldehyde:ferredoxin oxidoreductase